MLPCCYEEKNCIRVSSNQYVSLNADSNCLSAKWNIHRFCVESMVFHAHCCLAFVDKVHYHYSTDPDSCLMSVSYLTWNESSIWILSWFPSIGRSFEVGGIPLPWSSFTAVFFVGLRDNEQQLVFQLQHRVFLRLDLFVNWHTLQTLFKFGINVVLIHNVLDFRVNKLIM